MVIRRYQQRNIYEELVKNMLPYRFPKNSVSDFRRSQWN
jgi:hypothetical protein